ncbi:hypothetical protein LXA43DRAFT_977150 [Ganoderma leucocontextum]|nr:hypothetical protein LXA43DRAFT_977150 [Ganoderma leucocontextum]
MSTHPEAFVLLHIPEVILSTSSTSESGTLALECVTLAPDGADKDAPLAASLSAADRSLILVLRLGALELPLDPARPISLRIARDGTRTYTFRPATADASVQPSADKPKHATDDPTATWLTVPLPSRPDPHRAETVEALDHILAQYADFDSETEGGARHEAPHHPHEEEELRGKIVLMDEESGEIVGELPNRVRIKEDPALADAAYGKAKGREPAPVMLELPEDVYDAYTGAGTSVVPYSERSELDEAREIFVRVIPPEDQDWMTKSATLISHAISSSTSLLLNGLTSASSYYINHSTPAPTPKDGTPPPPPPRALLLLSHPRTQSTLSCAYAISGQAVKVSSKTAGIVEDLIKRANKAPAVRPRLQSSSSAPAASGLSANPPSYPGTSDGKPPLPPRHSASAAPTLGSGAPPRGKSPAPGSTPDASGSSTPAGGAKPLGRRGKLALSANLILATVDDSIRRTWDVGSERATAVVAHKYGPEAAKSTHLAAHTAKNVTLVYIDMRGLARKALIRRAGKHWAKARFGGGAGREMSGLVVDRQEQGKQ